MDDSSPANERPGEMGVNPSRVRTEALRGVQDVPSGGQPVIQHFVPQVLLSICMQMP